jgi:hypothetical protein
LKYIEGLADYLIWKDTCFAHDSPMDRMYPERWYQPGIDRKYQEICYHARGIGEQINGDDLENLLAFMVEHNFANVFVGHTHQPFIRQIDGRVICNVGSVGMPLDGNPMASWVCVEETPDCERILTLQRTPYDIDLILFMIDQHPDMFVADPQAGWRRIKWVKKLAITGKNILIRSHDCLASVRRPKGFS